MTTDKIDVLAVMDAESLHMGSLTSYRDRPAQAKAQRDMRQARAAVAELIAERDALRAKLEQQTARVVDAALRADAEQRVSDYLHTIADGGEVRLDPYDPNAIAPIVEAALARAQGGAA